MGVTQSQKRGKNDRITLDAEPRIEEGSLDEIVVSNCNVHLERMDDSWYYLGIYDSWSSGGLMLQFSIRARKGKVIALCYGNENTDGIEIDEGAV